MEDFETHIRFLFAVPFLILIEGMVDKSFIDYVKTSDQLIITDQQGSFNKMVEKIDKLSNLYLPEMLILLGIYFLIFLWWQDHSLFEGNKNYLVDPGSSYVRPAGYYYLFISLPIFQLLLFRWIWRWFIWVYSLARISSFKFKIEAVNSDLMAGLTYLNLVPLLFSFIFFSLSALFAAGLGENILYEGANLRDYTLDIIFFVLFIASIFYMPLLAFTPLLIRTKADAIHQLGSQVARHNHAYMVKWVYQNSPPEEGILGSVDHSSLSDMNGGYASVIDMKLIPINFKMFLLSCLTLTIPFIPLVFTYYSATDLFRLIVRSAVG